MWRLGPPECAEILVLETYKGETSRVQELLWSDWGYPNAGPHPSSTRAVFFANYHNGNRHRLLTNPCLAVYFLPAGRGNGLLTSDDFISELGKFDLD